jgi:hypothetical protein
VREDHGAKQAHTSDQPRCRDKRGGLHNPDDEEQHADGGHGCAEALCQPERNERLHDEAAAEGIEREESGQTHDNWA